MGAFGPPFFGDGMDMTIKVVTATNGKEQTRTFKVNNVFGTLNRAANPAVEVTNAVFGGLSRTFGGSVKLVANEPEAEPVRRGPGRPRKDL